MPTTNPNAPVTVAELDARLDTRFDAFEVKMKKIVEEAVTSVVTSLATTFHEAMLVMYEHVDGNTKAIKCLEKRVDSIDVRLTRVEATMVTKSYLDDKLFDFKGEIFERMDRDYVRRSELRAAQFVR